MKNINTPDNSDFFSNHYFADNDLNDYLRLIRKKTILVSK